MSDGEGELIQSLLEDISHGQDIFRRHILPLFVDGERGEPVVHGTGLLVAAADNFFLLSAAHVFDPMIARKPIYFFSEPETRRWLSGKLYVTSSPEARSEDTLDVGVLWLSTEGGAMPPYPAINCAPLPRPRLLPDAIPREGKRYLVMGYPTSKTTINTQRKRAVSMPFANYLVAAPHSRYGDFACDAKTHIIADFDVKNVIGKSGQRQRAPDQNGMSGSPIWLLADENWSGPVSDEFQVVGILTDHKRGQEKVLIGTDVRVAMELIAILSGIKPGVERPTV